MNTPMHQAVVDQLQAHKGQWPRIARESGISRRTIEKIANGIVRDPGVSLVERLHAYFESRRRSAA